MMHDEVDLARRFAAGDEAAVAEVHVRFSRGVWRWLTRKYGHLLPPGEIDDVLQDALIVLWERLEDFDPRKGSLRSWYFGIALRITRKRTTRGWVKQRRRETACDGDALERLPRPGSEALQTERDGDGHEETGDERSAVSPREELRAEYLPLMAELLGALSDCERAALLATIGGDRPISRAEAAARLGVNPNTFRCYLKRAHDHLQAECGRRGLPPPDWSVWEQSDV